MIDWYLVGTGGLWVLGLSIIVAAFGYHRWAAASSGRPLRDQLREPSWRAWWTAGLFLFCLGFGLSSGQRWWERVAWLLLAASFGWQAVGAVAARPR